MGSAQFDRDDEDYWGRQWARAYVHFAATEKRDYLHGLGCASRRSSAGPNAAGFCRRPRQLGPRFHLTWGTGPEVVRVFAEPVLKAEKRGWSSSRSDTVSTNSSATTVRSSGPRVGAGAEPTPSGHRHVARGRRRVRVPRTGGHRHHRRDRPQPRTGPGELADRPTKAHPGAHDRRRPRLRRRSDARAIAQDAGANLVNRDRMWHYTEGIHNGTRSGPTTRSGSIPGLSSLWLDRERRAPRAAELPRLRHQLDDKAIPPPVTTTRGSSSPTRSSRRSSHCRGPSRTRHHREGLKVAAKSRPARCARAHPGVPRPRRGLRHRAGTSPIWSPK